MENKTTVLTLCSIKGGVGKTITAIEIAKCLAAAGKKVLQADCDLNNSLSGYHLDEPMMEKTKKLNFAAALGDEDNNLCDFAVPTNTPGIDLIASSPYLSDLRTVSEKRLKRMIPSLYGKYDILIIDCHPTYDNIVLNALHAADYAITPVLKDLFSYNAAVFLSQVIPRDVEGFENWFILLNGYEKRYEESKSGRQNDFVDLYRNSGLPLTPASTWLPWTSGIYQIIDYRKKLCGAKNVPGAVCNEALYSAVTELAGCFFDEALDIPEAF
ncbi:MAG: ParA family protein [Treponema sp.]|jgi:chromosome partitioning protein|nr:ParA family protein [Treponema sp.]